MTGEHALDQSADDASPPYILNVLERCISHAANRSHEEVTFLHLVAHLLVNEQLVVLMEFRDVDYRALSRETYSQLENLPMARASRHSPSVASSVLRVLGKASGAASTDRREVGLTDLQWAVLDEIRTNPAHNRLRDVAGVPSTDRSVLRHMLEPRALALFAAGALCMLTGLILNFLGMPSERSEFALTHGLLYQTIGGFLVCAGPTILVARGSSGHFAFDFERKGPQAHFWCIAFFVVIPACVCVLLYSPATSVAADFSIITQRSWSQTLIAFGAYEGLVAAILAFEKALSLKATYQKIVGGLSALSIASALLIERITA